MSIWNGLKVCGHLVLYPIIIHSFHGLFVYLYVEMHLLEGKITFVRMLSLVSVNLFIEALAIRLMYRYAYKSGNQDTSVVK